jgi:PAS domain-containing protein
MRVCETKQNSPTDWVSQRGYYIDKFSPDTRLEQKPYFQQTLNSSNGYYLTGPYIDLGGNGVIRTYCKHLQTKTHNPKDKDTSRDEPEDAVLCLDFPLTTPIGDSVASAVARFGGAAARAQCDGLNCTVRDGPVGEPSFAEKFKALFYPSAKVNYDDSRDLSGRLAAAANQHQQANLTGQVTMLPSPSKPGLIRLAVPTEPGQILLVKIDLAAYQWWRSFWLSLAAGSAATTVLLFLLMFADYGLKVKEQERAFNAVDTIMSDVPAPYARVGEDGRFIKCNTAFANLLGYDSVEHAMPQLRNHLYEDYLDREGKEIYNAVKEERREGKEYRSYLVKLYTGGGPGLGPLVSVRVHGGDVPTPLLARKQPGQSFGIILRTEEPKPVAVRVHKPTEAAIVERSAPAGH